MKIFYLLLKLIAKFFPKVIQNIKNYNPEIIFQVAHKYIYILFVKNDTQINYSYISADIFQVDQNYKSVKIIL